MKNNKLECGGFFTFACCVFAILNFSLFACAAEPWWHNPQLDWKPFTNLPATSGYSYPWSIQERSGNGTHKFFAQYLYNSNLLVAVASVTPSFIAIPTGSLNPQFGYGTSTAMVRWNNSYDELFIGSYSGIWRFDEGLGQLVNVWWWTYDQTRIVSLGNAIYGEVVSWGSQSGTHIWTPSNHVRLTNSTWSGYPPIWADPISGRYGENNYKVRVISTNFSILVNADTGGGYSLDGGLSFQAPIGIQAGVGNLYVSDFYEYSNTNVIVNTGYNAKSLFIGPLGGIMYPLNCPTNNITTFFYSPSTRLLIAGDAATTNLYYAVLPAPDEVVGPKLQIQNAIILSWSTQYSSATLESSTDLNGVWQTVTNPQVIMNNQIQVAVPTTNPKMFFRLTSP